MGFQSPHCSPHVDMLPRLYAPIEIFSQPLTVKVKFMDVMHPVSNKLGDFLVHMSFPMNVRQAYFHLVNWT